jgi:hypothetical protein
VRNAASAGNTNLVTTDTHSSPAAPIRATAFVGRWPNIPAGEFPGVPTGTFSPTTATLVSGATEVLLIDALYLKDDVRDLGDLIERTGSEYTMGARRSSPSADRSDPTCRKES